MRPVLFAAAFLAVTPVLARAADVSQCAKLEHLTLDHARVVSAEMIAPGSFAAPRPPGGKAEALPIYRELSAFCRVVVDATPTTDSHISIEVWLPAADWNGKFQGQGNGGFAGSIDYGGLARSLKAGFATAGTDTGHAGDGIDASWALGHPEKIADFGWRGVHQMTQQGKAIARAYYSAPAKRSYFASCSDGGREALMEAQRFPADYDGILAGAPAYNWTALLTSAAVDMQTLLGDEASYIPPAQVPLIMRSIVAACDRLDGAKDGLITDPRACHFDAESIACKPGRTDNCLSAAQAKALNTLFAPLKVGDVTLPGFVPSGGEEDPNGWPNWVTGPARGKSAGVGFATGYFGNMVYNDRKWDFRSFDPVAGYAAAREKTSQSLNATSTDLSAFEKRGGKLIMYHGWADAAISPLYSISYYEGVQQKMGKESAASFVRLYMLPGVRHCAAGPGPDAIGQGFMPMGAHPSPANNAFLALEDWVENGNAPDTLIATKYANTEKPQAAHPAVRTGLICPYPQQAHYKGKGSVRRAESFACQ